MNYQHLAKILLLGCIIALFSCEDEVVTVNEGSLDFSSDTVKFDSIFVNFLSPSERLIVTNNSGKNIEINRIWLEAEESTEFATIIDGRLTNDISDLILRDGDSLLIFVNVQSELRDDFTEEFLAFQIGSEVQRVLLRAKVLDAYLFRSRATAGGPLATFGFLRDTTLTPEKPIVMDGPIVVGENVTLTILPGTQIFFTPYKFRANQNAAPPDTFIFFSQLFVNGTLNAEGTPDNPIVFQGSRLEEAFEEQPAQWRGIQFSQFSKDNSLKHVLIKNAQFGVRTDSTSINENPKLTMRQTEIRNMGAYGVWGVGFSADVTGPPSILMENCIVNTCKENTLFVWGGGNYRFDNCTFANFNLFRFSRRTPQFLLTDYGLFDVALIAPGNVIFNNCAVWGSEETELVLDLLDPGTYNLEFNNSLLRYAEDNEVDISPYLSESLINQDPLFLDVSEKNYRLQEGSPLINAGRDLSDRFFLDFRGVPDSAHMIPFDIGALEFIP